MLTGIAQLMIEFGAQKIFTFLRIGNFALPLKAGKLQFAAAPNCLDQLGIRVTAEIGKRRRLAVLFSHEEHGNKRRKNDQTGDKF